MLTSCVATTRYAAARSGWLLTTADNRCWRRRSEFEPARPWRSSPAATKRRRAEPGAPTSRASRMRSPATSGYTRASCAAMAAMWRCVTRCAPWLPRLSIARHSRSTRAFVSVPPRVPQRVPGQGVERQAEEDEALVLPALHRARRQPRDAPPKGCWAAPAAPAGRRHGGNAGANRGAVPDQPPRRPLHVYAQPRAACGLARGPRTLTRALPRAQRWSDPSCSRSPRWCSSARPSPSRSAPKT